jgi:hypothetical protein
MKFDKMKVDKILRQLEDVYPKAIAKGTDLKRQTDTEETRLPVLFFCVDENLIDIIRIPSDSKLEDFKDIRISGKGIRFLNNF